jgi:hypothetical protein
MRKISIAAFCILAVIPLALWIPHAQAQEPDTDVSPTMLAFGMVNVGTTLTLTTTIRNLGTADLTVTELVFSGSPDFTLHPAAPLPPFVVAPGAEVEVPVDYTPSVQKAVTAVLWVVSDDPDEGVVWVSLSGTGIACDIHVAPLALDFGVVPVGTTQTLATSLRNFGNAPCTVSGLPLSGSADFALNPGTSAAPFTIAPWATVDVLVDYTSSDFVADTGTLTIASDDPAEPQRTVALSGAPPANACDLTVSPVALDFGAGL